MVVRSPWARLGLFAGLLALAAVVVAFAGLPTPNEVQDRADEAGAAAPVVFAVTFALLGLLPVPLAPLSIAAGALFGFWVGLGTVLVAGIVSAALTFAISKALGRPAVASVSNARVAKLDARLQERGLVTVVALRLVPIMPFTVCNYACGLTAIPFRTYLIGTAVGIVPGSGAYVGVGAFGGEPGSLEFLVAIGGLALLTVVGITMSRRHVPARREP
ncbi:MAG: TVP38/TMEM64 family protein [Sporichthyaceae bacterium]